MNHKYSLMLVALTLVISTLPVTIADEEMECILDDTNSNNCTTIHPDLENFFPLNEDPAESEPCETDICEEPPQMNSFSTPQTVPDSILVDSTANALNLHDFNNSWSPSNDTFGKYGNGIMRHDSFATKDIQNNFSATRITGSMSIFMALRLWRCGSEDANNGGLIMQGRETSINGGATEVSSENILYAVTISSGCFVRYTHENAAGATGLDVTSSLKVTPGYHTIIMTRNIVSKRVIVQVDNIVYINNTYTNNPTNGENSYFRLGSWALAGNPVTGFTRQNPRIEIYETRLWNTEQSFILLHKLSNLADHTYDNVTSGSETGLWLLNHNVVYNENPLYNPLLLNDATGNGNDLTNYGQLRLDPITYGKYGHAIQQGDIYALTLHGLEANTSMLRTTVNNFSMFMQFDLRECPVFGAGVSLINIASDTTSAVETAGQNQLFTMGLQQGLCTFTYKHEFGAGVNIISNTAPLGVGNHTMIVVRNNSLKNAKVYLDSNLVINFNYTDNPSNGEYAYLRILSDGIALTSSDPTRGMTGLNTVGSTSEIRIWNKVESLATLLKLANANDHTYDHKLVGDELAVYFFDNEGPTANAGPDQPNAEEGQLITLNGCASTDPENNVLSYHWTQIQGQTVTLSNPNICNPTFTMPTIDNNQDTLEFNLNVNDTALSSDDTVIIGSNCVSIANSSTDLASRFFTLILMVAVIIFIFVYLLRRNE